MLERSTGNLQDIHKKISELIKSAIKTEEREFLKKAADECTQAIKDYPEEISLRKKLVESYVLCISILGGYDVDEQAESWEKFASANELFTFDMGRDYLVDQFLKSLLQFPLEEKQCIQILRACDTVRFACVYLYSEFVWKQENPEKYDNFIKKINLYQDVSRKQLAPRKNGKLQEDFSRSAIINIDALDGLPEWDKEPISAAKINMCKLISESYQEYQRNRKLLNIKTIYTTQLLTAYMICDFYEYNVDFSITNKHRRQLLDDYRNSKLVSHIKKSTNLASKGNIYDSLSNLFVEIFTSSFPVMDVEKAGFFIKNIKKNISSFQEQNMGNQILSDLAKSILLALDNFFQYYKNIHAFYSDCEQRLANPDMQIPELLAIEKNLEEMFVDTLPKPWRASFHEKIVEVNIGLKSKDKNNEEKYKKAILHHFYKAKECYPPFQQQVHMLYNAEINAFEADDARVKIFNSIKADVLAISKNKNNKALNKSLLSNFYHYLGTIIKLPTWNYYPNRSLLDNLVGVVLPLLNSIKKYKLEMIYFCQLIEQILKAAEFEARLPEVYQAIFCEIVKFKIQGFSTEKLPGFGQQYISGLIFLKTSSQLQPIDDEMLEQALDEMIGYYDKNGLEGKTFYYLEQGILSFPENILFHQKWIFIEKKKFKNDIKNIPFVPLLIENTENSAISEYKRLLDSHSILIKAFLIIQDNCVKAKSLVNQYEEILSSIDPGQKLNILFREIQSAHQDIVRLIEEYKKMLSSFNNEKNQFDLLVTRIKNYKMLKPAEKVKLMFFNAYLTKKPFLTDINIEKSADLGVIQIELSTNKLELNFKRNNILLNGAGKSISLNMLSILFELDKSLRQLGSSLIFKGSVVARFGIYFYNEQPHLAGLFPINDVDIYIPFNPDINCSDIIDIITQYGFVNTSEYINNHYLQFNQSVEGTNIDLTLVTQAAYVSLDFLPLRMGKMEFVHEQAQHLVKTCKFKLIPPSGLENEFISACQFKEFPTQPPGAKFRAYCYGAHHYLSKLAACGVHEFKGEAQPSNELYTMLVEYFKEQLQDGRNLCYRELEEFIKRGINVNTSNVAARFIATFFYALLGDQVGCNRQLIADNCAKHFIQHFDLCNNGEIIQSYNLKEVVESIAFVETDKVNRQIFFSRSPSF